MNTYVVLAFKLVGTNLAQSCVKSSSIIPNFNELKDGEARRRASKGLVAYSVFEKLKQMIEMTANMLIDMGTKWEQSSNEDKQAFVHTLFSEIVFDLDTHRITSFRLQSWAEQFLQIRAVCDGAVMCLERFQAITAPLPSARIAAQVILDLIYKGEKAAQQTWEKLERNAEIYRRYINGEDSVVLAHAFGLSDRRIRSIIERERGQQ